MCEVFAQRSLYQSIKTSHIDFRQFEVGGTPVSTGSMKTETTSITHDRLQADCYQWHHNTHAEDRHLIHANVSNSVGGRRGSYNTAIGVKKGRADLQYFKKGRLYLFEFKVGYDRQKPEQTAFQIANEAEGAYYFLIRQQDEYQRIVENVRANPDYYSNTI